MVCFDRLLLRLISRNTVNIEPAKRIGPMTAPAIQLGLAAFGGVGIGEAMSVDEPAMSDVAVVLVVLGALPFVVVVTEQRFRTCSIPSSLKIMSTLDESWGMRHCLQPAASLLNSLSGKQSPEPLPASMTAFPRNLVGSNEWYRIRFHAQVTHYNCFHMPGAKVVQRSQSDQAEQTFHLLQSRMWLEQESL